MRKRVSSTLGSAEEQIGPGQPAIRRAIRRRAMLRASLEHVVLEAHKFHPNIKRVLAANQVDIVIKLIIVGSDLRGAVACVANGCAAREAEHRQAVGSWITGYLNAGNTKLRRKIQASIPILRVDKEARPAEARSAGG